MKKYIGFIAIVLVLIGLLLVSGCVHELSVNKFEELCTSTGGYYSETRNSDYNVCECHPGRTYAVYYKDVKNNKQLFKSGCDIV